MIVLCEESNLFNTLAHKTESCLSLHTLLVDIVIRTWCNTLQRWVQRSRCLHTIFILYFAEGCLQLKKECSNVGNGDFQACGGCHFFASCSEGYLYVRACPEALLFDAISGVCDYHSRSCPT